MAPASVTTCKFVHKLTMSIYCMRYEVIWRTTHLTSGVETTSDTHDPYRSVNHVRKMYWIVKTSPTSHISSFTDSRLRNGNLVAMISVPINAASSAPNGMSIRNTAVWSFVIFEEKSLKINYNKCSHHRKKAASRHQHTRPFLLVKTDNSSRLTQLSQRYRKLLAPTKDCLR